MLKTGLWAVALATASTVAHTQSLELDGLDGDLPVVLTATRLKQSQADVPASVSIIDRKMITLSGAREVHELLRLVPGMVVMDDDNGYSMVAYHGTSPDNFRRMQVLIDGRSVYQPGLSFVDWLYFPLALDDIERVEVTRGPNSAAYGANAFFAIINFITRDPRETTGARIALRKGEDDVRDAHVRIGGEVGQASYRLSAFGLYDEGYDRGQKDAAKYDARDRKAVDFLGQLALSEKVELGVRVGMLHGEQEMTPHFLEPFVTAYPEAEIDQRYASVSGTWELSPEHRLEARLNYTTYERDEPFEATLPPAAFFPTLGALFDANRDYANQFVEAVANGDAPPPPPSMTEAVLLQAFLTQANSFGMTFGLDPTAPILGVHADQSFDVQRVDGELQDTYVFSDKLRLVGGIGWRQDRAYSQTFFDRTYTNAVGRVFGHGEWRVAEDWLLNAGLTWERDHLAGEFYSPRVAVNWHFTDHQTVKAIVSKAVHTPDLFEQRGQNRFNFVLLNPQQANLMLGSYYAHGQSPGDAPTEKILSHELSWFAHWPMTHVTADIKLFRDDLELADHEFDQDTFTIRPTRDFESRGVEGSINWEPVEGQRLMVHYLNLAVTSPTEGFEEFSKNGNFYAVPRHTGGAAWWMDLPSGWQSGLSYYFSDKVRKFENWHFNELAWRLGKEFQLGGNQKLNLSGTYQYRLEDDPELRKWNFQSDRHRAWASAEWQY